ncbi:PEP-CTERM sorting domain-containing protein [Akkermansia sp.]|uniref:PEP-CTERM sorting domain-containing protein n=1 Tax=Akkermansia sp. TaxID=1872421 RepID=UPI0025C158A3|nr:PEP-CTERM sorting domain-containing protein [Akkermansia sp.]MCC8147379.1 PEP-CTERM sorting domain-containing protein [Akkermansia sp.]
MKKTLILIASLSFGTAVSQAAVLCSTTFNRTGTSLDTVTVNTVSDVGLTSSTSISTGDFHKSTTGNDLLGNGSIPATVFSPNANVGNADNNTWSVSFTFTNTSGQNMSISSIDLSMIGFTSGGEPQHGAGNGVVNMPADAGWIGGNSDGNTNKPINLTLAISGQADQMLTYNGATSTNGSGTWEGIRTGSYNYDNLVLGAGDNLIITITASKNSAYSSGCFAGLTGIQINGELMVPEPATTSLGLLGLAALMMRRRRA